MEIEFVVEATAVKIFWLQKSTKETQKKIMK
jgi:hypothetical protein